MDLRSRETRKLTEGLRVGCLAWSPDGRRLAVTLPGQEIGILSAESGAVEQTVAPSERTIVGTPAWTPDSQRLAFPVYWGEIVSTAPLAIRYTVNRI
ncbi:MAG: TolB family protein, partial [Candidatus Methylomirabilales bacterium]